MPAEKYCPKCQSLRVPVRGDPDWCLLIILFFFFVFPGIIYLIIFYASEPNKCITCNSWLVSMPPEKLTLASGEYQTIPPANAPSQPLSTPIKPPAPLKNPVAPPSKHPATKNYCPFCGNPIEANSHFCAACGANLE